MADPSLIQLIGSGFVGSAFTWGLTWLRERRRMTEGYRAPQRQVVGDVIAATHDLFMAESVWANAMIQTAKAERGEEDSGLADGELESAIAAFQKAIFGVDRAFQAASLNHRGGARPTVACAATRESRCGVSRA